MSKQIRKAPKNKVGNFQSIGEALKSAKVEGDPVNFPKHYRGHPSGIEAIQVTEHFNFCMGNALKYIWRADYKGSALEDLKKARWYLDREINKREGSKNVQKENR